MGDEPPIETHPIRAGVFIVNSKKHVLEGATEQKLNEKELADRPITVCKDIGRGVAGWPERGRPKTTPNTGRAFTGWTSNVAGQHLTQLNTFLLRNTCTSVQVSRQRATMQARSPIL